MAETLEELAVMAREATARAETAFNLAQTASQNAAAAVTAADSIKRGYAESEKLRGEKERTSQTRSDEAYSAAMRSLSAVNELTRTVAAVDRKTDEILRTEGARSARVMMLLGMQLTQLLVVVSVVSWWFA